MPFILIIVGIIAALGFGGFMFMQKPTEIDLAAVTPVARFEEATSTPINLQTKTADTTPVTPDTIPAKKPSTPTTPVTPITPVTPTPVVTIPATAYKNGTYNVTTSYIAPGNNKHTVTATVVIKNDVVTEAKLSYGGDDNLTSKEYQGRFASKYQSQVIGTKIDAIALSRVGGASLTTGAYNKALAEVKATAKS